MTKKETTLNRYVLLTTADGILRRLKQGGFETWKDIETELGIDKSNFKELVGWYETDTYSRPVSELLKEGYKKVYIKPVITIMDGRVEDEKFVAYRKGKFAYVDAGNYYKF